MGKEKRASMRGGGAHARGLSRVRGASVFGDLLARTRRVGVQYYVCEVSK